jgi:hypothetical protein
MLTDFHRCSHKLGALLDLHISLTGIVRTVFWDAVPSYLVDYDGQFRGSHCLYQHVFLANKN